MVERQLRNGEKESWLSDLAMDSNSVVATASVSRSESLLRQVMTRCLSSDCELVECRLLKDMVCIVCVFWGFIGGR